MDFDERTLHLEFVQAAISRMAQNSFTIKSWTITIVSGMFALAANKSNPLFVLLGYFPVCAFWILDAYYLRQETLFRKLYDKARLPESKLQLSMDTSEFKPEVGSWFCTLISPTLSLFYGVIGAAILAVMFGLRG